MSSWRVKLSLVSVVPILITGGMNLALGLGWNSFSSVENTKHFRFSWFIGLILGVFITAPFSAQFPKRFITMISALLTLCTGIMSICLPQHYKAIIISRYLNGVAVGLVTIVLLASISELPVRQHRARWIGFEQLSLALGILILVIFQVTWKFNIKIPIYKAYGIVYTVLAVVALSAVWFYTESPLHYMRRGNYVAAEQALDRILDTTSSSNLAKTSALQQCKQYFDYNKDWTLWEVCSDSWRPFFNLLIYRALVAFCFSQPMNVNIQLCGFIAAGRRNVVASVLYAVLRFLGAAVGLVVFDFLGRKLISLLALLLSTCMLLVIAIIFFKGDDIYTDQHQMSGICALSIIFQLGAGIYASSSSIYLSEAFPMVTKPYLIAACVTLEQIIHIVIINSFFNDTRNMAAFSISVAALMCCGLSIFASIPETKRTSMLEAQQLFQPCGSCRSC